MIVKNVMERIGTTPLFNNFISMLNLLAKFSVDVDMDNEESYATTAIRLILFLTMNAG